MDTIEVGMDLPFYLRLENPITVRYEEVCHEAQIPELIGRGIDITFSQRSAGSIDNSDPSAVRTTVDIKAESVQSISEESAGKFAIRNCLEILNRLIISYQAATESVVNTGFVQPLGTSDMKLYARIRLNGRDIRDRWPSLSVNTMPLLQEVSDQFYKYLIGQDELPLSSLFLTSAVLSLERGQYALAVLQSATAVELQITHVVSTKLRNMGWTDQAIAPYENMTLGRKLHIPKTDTRSLETYFGGITDFDGLYVAMRDVLTPLRNRVAHRGYLPSHDEAIDAVQSTRIFLAVVR